MCIQRTYISLLLNKYVVHTPYTHRIYNYLLMKTMNMRLDDKDVQMIEILKKELNARSYAQVVRYALACAVDTVKPKE